MSTNSRTRNRNSKPTRRTFGAASTQTETELAARADFVSQLHSQDAALGSSADLRAVADPA